MLKIERLNLRLAHCFDFRATDIAHLIGTELSNISWDRNINIATLRLPPFRFSPTATDREVAQSVAAAIVQIMNGGNR